MPRFLEGERARHEYGKGLVQKENIIREGLKLSELVAGRKIFFFEFFETAYYYYLASTRYNREYESPAPFL